MTLQRLARRLALLAVIFGTAWLFAPKPGRPPKVAPGPAGMSPLPAGAPPAPTTSRAAPAPFPPPVAAPSPRAPVPPPEDAAAAVAVDQVRLMLRDYRTLTGENPVGTNAEIMRALMGDNPRQATLGPPAGQTLNDQGELVDRWGTPLFFHQLSKTVMEIRSAGPDRVMWTEDDIVAR